MLSNAKLCKKSFLQNTGLSYKLRLCGDTLSSNSLNIPKENVSLVNDGHVCVCTLLAHSIIGKSDKHLTAILLSSVIREEKTMDTGKFMSKTQLV